VTSSGCSRTIPADALPADVLLLCGIFGNVSDRGIEDVAFDALETSVMIGVGVSRLGRAPAAGRPDGRLFTFRGP
jgi:hypothetical protein